MEVFKFRLEKILQYRTKIAKESEKKLSQKAQQCHQIEQQITNAKQARSTNNLMHGSHTRDLDTMQQAAIYDEYLRERSLQLKKDLSYLEKEKQILQRDYIEKLKSQKIIDNLKQNQLEQYKIIKMRHDGHNLDDIIASQHFFKEK